MNAGFTTSILYKCNSYRRGRGEEEVPEGLEGVEGVEEPSIF
jgi:hypothetical protein